MFFSLCSWGQVLLGLHCSSEAIGSHGWRLSREVLTQAPEEALLAKGQSREQGEASSGLSLDRRPLGTARRNAAELGEGGRTPCLDEVDRLQNSIVMSCLQRWGLSQGETAQSLGLLGELGHQDHAS